MVLHLQPLLLGLEAAVTQRHHLQLLLLDLGVGRHLQPLLLDPQCLGCGRFGILSQFSSIFVEFINGVGMRPTVVTSNVFLQLRLALELSLK